MKNTTPKVREARKTRGANDASFKVPALKTFARVGLERLDPENLRAEAEKLRNETLPKLNEQVTAVLDWLLKVKTEKREEQEIIRGEIEKSQQWFIEYLNHEFDPFRRTVWLAVLRYCFSKPLKSQEETEEWLNKLCSGDIGIEFKFPEERGYLHETMEYGPLTLTIFGKNYLVNSLASFDEQEVGQLRNVLNELVKRVGYEQRLVRQNKTNILLKQGILSTKELLEERKAGLFSTMSLTNGSGPNIAVLVYSNGRDIFLRQTEGALQEEMAELKKIDKPLFLPTLIWETIPPDYFTVKARLQPREAKLMMLLRNVLKNGIVWKAKKERIQGWREELQKLASGNKTVTMEEFLKKHKPEPGFCFLEMEGKFDWETPEEVIKVRQISNLFFVAERKLGENGQSACRLVRYPTWLKEFFADCRGEWLEGENFDDLPQNMKLVFRKIRGQIEKRSQIEK